MSSPGSAARHGPELQPSETQRSETLGPRSPSAESRGLSDVLTGLSRQNAVYRRTIAVCDQLADAALRQVGPDELTAVFADLVDRRIVLLDPAFRPRAQAGGAGTPTMLRWNRSDPSIGRLLRALQAERRPLRVPSVPDTPLEQSCLISPVVVSDNTLGYLLVLDDDTREADDVDLLTISYAATLFALTLAHERTSTELGLRYQRAVVDALVSGHFVDAEDACQKARSLGLSDIQPYRVAVVRLDAATEDAAVEECGARLASALPGTVATTGDGTVVAVLPEPPEGIAAGDGTPALIEKVWADLGAAATCGLSERLDRPELAPSGFRQAEQAIELAVRLRREGGLIRYDDLGIYRLLFRIGDSRQLWRFAEDVLGALLRYDASHPPDLVHTLSVYLHHHGSLKQTARALRLHANTVSYRAQRIEQITGLDLTDPDDRLVAHVAVKIIETNR